MIYESIIIGRGLIGSAAAKYISQSQKNVALIGPDEATALEQQIVFASHYDRARIQRIVGKDSVETLLNFLSARQHTELEKESNINYYVADGCLLVTPDDSDNYSSQYKEEAKKFDVDYQIFNDASQLKSFNAHFHFPDSAKGIYEPAPSGHINPRLLIKAQSEVFKKNGGEIFNNTVKEITYQNDAIKINCVDDETFYAKKVLLAPGSFVNFLNLLKNKLFLKVKSETTIWVKVNEQEAQRLSSLPGLLYKINEPEIQDIYLIRPLRYPDGNFYLKMGANLPNDIYFTSLQEIQEWFKNGHKKDNRPVLEKALKSILPYLLIEEIHEKRCIVCYTKHGKPYIGPIEKGLYVAAGGNGYAAMSSDALGKIAATLLLENRFPAEFSAKDFEPVFETEAV
ncbi:MAG: FAD-binding oxidoreductase [Bacteroidota bacterium]|nr:FAD-binding oxidoreductase [Bacteroidota bacterium]